MQEKVKKKRNRLTERLEKRDAKRSLAYLERVFEESAYFGVAYVLGNAEMAFGTSPLGLALLCAGRGHVLAILAGLLLSAVMHPSRSAVYAVMYGVAAIVRIVSRMLLEGDDRTELRKRAKEKLDAARGEASPLVGEVGIAQRIRAELSLLFSERVRLRMATAAVCSMVVSLYRVFVGGFTYYDWFAAVFCVLVTPAAVMIYAIYLDGHSTHRWLYVISASFLLYSLVWSASGLWIAYYPLPLILAIFFTLYATLTMGTAFGCFAGVLCGVAIHFLTAPAFLLAALVFSAFRSKRKGAAGILPAVSVALIWLLYVGGVAQLQRLVPALLIGGAAFTPVCVYLRGKEERKAREEMDAAESDSVRRRLAGQHRTQLPRARCGVCTR